MRNKLIIAALVLGSFATALITHKIFSLHNLAIAADKAEGLSYLKVVSLRDYIKTAPLNDADKFDLQVFLPAINPMNTRNWSILCGHHPQFEVLTGTAYYFGLRQKISDFSEQDALTADTIARYNSEREKGFGKWLRYPERVRTIYSSMESN